ncbi:hypothetical protein K0H59_04425 [Shewanella sp. FJAT-51649]|uniref:hypothetical protein n=1 Tax=Shewanella sp. FJAT-51649 TaxID=2864210 RepID=UPI001C65B9F7|nr:hypothetical protein [Shewanella sp. FJAT-51649]QYJ72309.1 hypothetical protein K0H59_04425 [Shewanella sp. FJAT-51649]
MNTEAIQIELDKLDSRQKSVLLLTYGHQLTVMARDAYEFQGPGVNKPRLLRDANEILHRVFQALRELETQADEFFSLQGIAHWISCDEKEGDIVYASKQAFSRALQKCNT